VAAEPAHLRSSVSAVDAAALGGLGLELVVLDLDGTACLLDIAWEDVKRRLVTIAALHGLRTAGHRRVLGLLETARRAGNPAALAALEAELEESELEGARTCLVNAALVGWVAALPDRLPLGVLSLNASSAVETALARAGLRSRVATVIGRGGARPKPDPEGLELLLSRHGAAAGRTLMVGDSDADRGCAAGAGVAFLGVEAIGVEWIDPGCAA
jgi:phosphoglycolate phosphatase-like HAD superfamily hydrolase